MGPGLPKLSYTTAYQKSDIKSTQNFNQLWLWWKKQSTLQKHQGKITKNNDTFKEHSIIPVVSATAAQCKDSESHTHGAVMAPSDANNKTILRVKSSISCSNIRNQNYIQSKMRETCRKESAE